MAKGGIKGITIEIGGDTTTLDKALSGINKSAKSTQTELKQVEKLLKLDPTNTELVAQKQKLLGDAINTTKERLNTLKTAEEQAQQQFAKGEISEQQYRELQREIIATEKQLEELENQAKQGNISLEKVAEVTNKIGTGAENLGKKLLPVTAGITAIGAASIASFNEVDAGYDTIITKTGATGEALEGLQESMDNVFANLPTDAETAGIAIGEVNTRFGETGETLEDLSTQFIQFSEINGVDLNNSIGTVDRVMEQFGVTSENTAGVLGLLTSKGQETGVSLDTLLNTAQRHGPTFKEMGLGLEESIVLLAEMEANGVNADTAMVGLRRAVQAYTKEGMTTEEGLQRTIASIKDAATETEALSIATEIFGTKGAAEMTQAIREGRLSVDDLSASFKDYENVVEDTFNATLDPPDQAKIALNNLKLAGSELATSLFSMLQPALDKIVTKVKEFTQWFKNLNDSQKETIIKVAAVVAAIGPALIIFGKVMQAVSGITTAITEVGPAIKAVKTAFTALKTAFVANPIGIVVAAIAALIAILVVAYNKCDWFREMVDAAFAEVKEAIGQAIEAVKPIIQQLIQTFKDIMTALKPVVDFIINVVVAKIKALLAFLPSIIAAVKNVIDFVTNIINAFVALFKGDFDGFGQYIMAALQSVWDFIKNIVTGIVNFVVTFLESMGVNIKEIFSNIWQAIVGVFQGIGQWFADRWNDIVTAFSTAAEWFGTMFQNAWNNIVAIFIAIGPWFAARWLDIQNALSAVATWFQTMFQTAWNNIVAVFSAIGQWFAARWLDIQNALSAVATWFHTMFSNAWNNIVAVFSGIGQWFAARWQDIQNAFAEVVTFFQTTFNNAWNAIENAFSSAGSFFGDLWNSIVTKFTDIGVKIGEAVGGAFKAIVNGVIGTAENIINGFFNLLNGAIGVINAIPGVNIPKVSLLSFPRMAKGGVLKEGQAIMAEAGPELISMVNGEAIVTPLTRSAKNTAVESAGGTAPAGFVQNVHLHSPKEISPAEAARQLRNANRRMVLQLGKG